MAADSFAEINEDSKPLFNRRFNVELFLVALVCASMYLVFAQCWTKFSRAEVFFAESSREMLLMQNWVTPLFHSKPFFDKPVLVYWLIIACYKLFGISHLTARVPSILSAIVTVIMTGLGTTALFKNRLAGLLAAMAVGSSFMFFSFAYLCMSDMLLTAFDTITMSLLYLGIQNEKSRTKLWWFASISLGLAFTTKGPVGIVLPVISFLLYLGLTKLLSIITFKQILLCGITTILLAAPWFIAAYTANGSGAIAYFFIRENFQRFAGSTYDTHKPIWFMAQSLMTGFLPWSIFLPIILWKMYVNRNEMSTDKPKEFYLWLWILVVIGFFSVSRGKCDYYALPAYPAAASLVGIYLSRWIKNASSIPKFYAYGFVLASFGVAIGLSFFLPKIANSQFIASWCALPVTIVLMALIILFMAKKNEMPAVYACIFMELCMSGIAFASQIFPAIIAQQPIKDYVAIFRRLPAQAQIGVDVSLAPWIDQITFESGREPVTLNNPDELRKFVTTKQLAFEILPEEAFKKAFNNPSGLKIVDKRKAISHALNPGYVFKQGGDMYDSTILLISNQ